MNQFRYLCLTLLIFMTTGVCAVDAGTILFSGGKADMPYLYALNYYTPSQFVIQDLGIPRGGLDAKLDVESDTSSIILQRPSSYILTKSAQRPTILALAVAAKDGSPITVNLSLIRGSLYANTDRLSVFWNDQMIVNLDCSGRSVQEEKDQVIQDFTAKIPGHLVKQDNVLWLQPVRREPVVIDAIQLQSDGPLKALPYREAQKLLGHFDLPIPPEKPFAGKVLLCDMYHYVDGVLEYELCKSIGAQVDSHRGWVPPGQWKDYPIVILRNRHKLNSADNHALQEYVKAGGTLVLSRDQLAWFYLGTPRLTPKDLAWIGLTYPDSGPAEGVASQQQIEVPDNNSLGVPPLTIKFDMPVQPIHYFKLNSSFDPKEIWASVILPSGSMSAASVYVHSVGKGRVIGMDPAYDPRYLNLSRQILTAILEDK